MLTFHHLIGQTGHNGAKWNFGMGSPTGSLMDRFIQQENLKHLGALLARTTDEAERQRIVRLIEEEEAKTSDQIRPLRSGGGQGF
jgi:hypothetical protein